MTQPVSTPSSSRSLLQLLGENEILLWRNWHRWLRLRLLSFLLLLRRHRLSSFLSRAFFSTADKFFRGGCRGGDSHRRDWDRFERRAGVDLPLLVLVDLPLVVVRRGRRRHPLLPRRRLPRLLVLAFGAHPAVALREALRLEQTCL